MIENGNKYLTTSVGFKLTRAREIVKLAISGMEDHVETSQRSSYGETTNQVALLVCLLCTIVKNNA